MVLLLMMMSILTSASGSFYSYIPHFPSPSTSFTISRYIIIPIGTKISDTASDMEGVQTVFMIAAGVHLTAAVLQFVLSYHYSDEGVVEGGDEEGLQKKRKDKMKTKMM